MPQIFPMPQQTVQTGLPPQWQMWVKDIQGCPEDFIFRHESDRSEFTRHSMSSSHSRNLHSFLKALGVPSNRCFYFRAISARGSAEYFTPHCSQPSGNPSIHGEDVVLEFSKPNVLLLWKAFCLLHDRENKLFSLLGRTSGNLPDHERLARYYREFLSREEACPELLTFSLPASKMSGSGTPYFDHRDAPSSVTERRIVIARPHHTNGLLEAAATEYLDVGSVSSTRSKPGGEYPLVPFRTIISTLPGVAMFLIPNQNHRYLDC